MNHQGKSQVVRATRTTYRETAYVAPDGASGGIRGDPLGDRFYRNEDILAENDIIGTIFNTLANALFSHGFAFRRGDEWLQPTDLFESAVRTYWRELPRKILAYMLCQGFVVWFTYRTPEGIWVPDIPDRSKIQIEYVYDTVTGVDLVDVSWVDKKITSRLYIIQSGLSTSSSGRKGKAPIDRAKHLLRRYYLYDESKIVATHRAARPPEIVQPVGMSRKIVSRMDDMPPPDSMINRAITLDELSNYETVMYNNLNAEMDEARKLFKTTSNQTIRPHMRLQNELDRPYEANFLRIPAEMQHAAWNAPLGLTDVSEILRVIRAQVFILFGVPHGISGRSSNTVGADKEIEVSDDTYANTLRAYGDDFTTVLTAMYRQLHEESALQPSDIKRTRTEQNKRTVAEELETGDLLYAGASKQHLVEMMLMHHALDDKEAAEDFYQHGLINSKTLYSRHPQLLEEERELRQARLAGNTNAAPPRKKLKK